MSTFDKQLAKIQNDKGFIAALDQSGGSTPKALKLYGVDETAWKDEKGMYDVVHAHALAPHQEPGVLRQAADRRDPVREHDGPRHRRQADADLSLGRRRRRAVPEGRQRPRRREGRRPGHEADAGARRAAEAREGEERIRHQDALRHQASGTPPASTPSSSSSSTSASRSSPPAWCRSSSPRSTSRRRTRTRPRTCSRPRS